MEALATLLLALLVIAVVTAVATLLALWLGARALRKRNQVVPGTPTAAPTVWMASPASGARLHRRLRTAVAVARSSAAAAVANPQLVELTAELEREALALDGHVVVASRIVGKEGRARMSALSGQVRQIEQMASQVSMLAVQAQAALVTQTQGSALEDLARQLDLLEQARHEVAAVEQAAGVHRVSPFADPDRTTVGPTPRLEKAPPGQTMPGH